MLDDESVTRFLNLHQTGALSDEYLEKIIREKKLEREVALSQFDDELFLLRTLKLHQPLFHILIDELGSLITNDCRRDIFPFRLARRTHFAGGGASWADLHEDHHNIQQHPRQIR